MKTYMINLPEPVAWFANYDGNVYTEAQLKQAVRDAQGVTELADALSALVDCITETRGTHADAALVKARTALSKYKGAKA